MGKGINYDVQILNSQSFKIKYSTEEKSYFVEYMGDYPNDYACIIFHEYDKSLGDNNEVNKKV